MGKFYNGVTDSQETFALSRIEWKISYGVMRGTCPDDDLFRLYIPDAARDENGIYPTEGRFTVTSGIVAGSQEMTVNWYVKNSRIMLSIAEITKAY